MRCLAPFSSVLSFGDLFAVHPDDLAYTTCYTRNRFSSVSYSRIEWEGYAGPASVEPIMNGWISTTSVRQKTSLTTAGLTEAI